jgi:hypothetical protein
MYETFCKATDDWINFVKWLADLNYISEALPIPKNHATNVESSAGKASCFTHAEAPLVLVSLRAAVRHEADHSPYLVPRSRICGVIPPLPNTPSWHGAQSTGTILPLP